MNYLILLASLFFSSYPKSETKLSIEERKIAVDAIIEEESDFAKANCFCRIGDKRGSQEKEYPNSYHDFGKIDTYTGAFPVNQKNDDKCGSKCSALALQWAKSLNDSQLCNYFKKNGTNTLVAYAKVGGKNWSIRQTLKTVNCCLSGGILTCPSGWNPENTNLPGYCSRLVCAPLINGNTRLYNNDNSIWGFVWENNIYQVRRGTVSPAIWNICK